MRGGGLLAVGLALLAGCTTIGDRLETVRTPDGIAQATADFYVRDVGDACCSVAVVTPSGTVFANAGGADEHTLYRTASLSKLFFHSALLKLQAEGRLNLDRPVGACSRLDLPPEYRTVTLRDLLHNRSGLPREFLLRFEPGAMFAALFCGCVGTDVYGSFQSRDDFARETWRPWWRYAVRHKREIYSNVGFGLLGTAVEDVLDRSLEDIVRREVAEPLRLEDTTYAPHPDQTNRVARACAGQLPWFTPRGREVPEHRLGEALRATGGLFSSAADCATFCASYWHVLDGQLQERVLDAYHDDQLYGLLRAHSLPSGRRVLYRAGMIYGGASFVGFDPVDRTIVIILRNVTSWPDDRGFAVMDALARARRTRGGPEMPMLSWFQVAASQAFSSVNTASGAGFSGT